MEPHTKVVVTRHGQFTLFFETGSPFCSFHESTFQALDPEGVMRKFVCSEQYFMFHKALLANDKESAEKIMQLGYTQSMKMKMIGRSLEMTEAQLKLWNEVSTDVMRKAVLEKFTQNPHLLKFLFFSHGTRNVEASPTDRIWGIGMPITHPKAGHPIYWLGANRLGSVLDDVREELWERPEFRKLRDEVQEELIQRQKDFLEGF